MTSRQVVLVGLASVVLVLSSATLASAEDEPIEALNNYRIDAPADPQQPVFDRRNLQAVEALDSRGNCLYRYSVFPQSPALAPDEFGVWEVAADVYRSELLREYSDDISGVSFEYDEQNEIIAASVHAVVGSKAAESSLEGLYSRLGEKFRVALRELEADGVTFELARDSVQSLQAACVVEDQVLYGPLFKAMGVDGFGLSSSIDERTGILEVTVPIELLDRTREWLSQFGLATEVSGSAHEDSYTAGRGSSYTPRIGASRLRTLGGSTTSYCSNGYRIGGNVLLMPYHCGYTNWYSTQLNVNVYSGTTGPAYSLNSANVDAQLLYGSTYSNKVWLGDALGTSTIPVIGFVTESQIVTGYYYLASNGFEGQGAIIMDSKWRSKSYYNDNTGSWELMSHLYVGHPDPASPFWSGCAPNNSGSPWMVYLPGASSFPAIGTLTGQFFENSVSGCSATSMAAVSYLYGGASVG